MAIKSLPRGLYDSRGRIRIEISRGTGQAPYRETLDLSSTNQRDIDDAIAIRVLRKKRIDQGLPPVEVQDHDSPVAMLFGDAIDVFIGTEEVAGRICERSEDIKEETVGKFGRILRNDWLPNFEGKTLPEITKAMVEKVLRVWPCKDKTRKNALVPLRLLFKHFGFDVNPANGIEFKKKKSKNKIDRYSPEERTALIEYLGTVNRTVQLFAVLLFAGGFRTGEAQGLQWGDWDGKDMHVDRQVLSEGYVVERVKYENNRYVRIPKWAHVFLNNFPTRFKAGFILLNERGKPFTSRKELYKIWKAAHEALDIRYRDFYTCRHTRAAELISMGVDYGKAAKQLGHTPEMFLRTYSEWREDYARQHRNDDDLEGVGLVGATA